jgi:hypothetical protein
MKQRRKMPHEKGPAIYSAPFFAGVDSEVHGEAKTGE